MKNSTPTKNLTALLDSWHEFHSTVIISADSERNSSNFPINLYGVKGSLYGFYMLKYIERRIFNAIHEEQYKGHFSSVQEDYLIVCTTQKEADECETDLNTIFEDQIEVLKMNWWGVVPYRMAGVGSSVFGERAAFLSKLAMRNPVKAKPRVFIVSQRALLTPVPPASYIRKQACVVRKGQSLDIDVLAEKLTELGYLRVPRVSVKGEFAIRGEVLDVFLSGEDYATRILFDFDEIGNIKSFDSETQVSKESLKEVLIYPNKEVIWTDELVDTLEKVFQEEDSKGIVNDFAVYDARRRHGADSAVASSIDVDMPTADSPVEADRDEDSSSDRRFDTDVHLAFTEKAKKERDRILMELGLRRESEGEELFYGILWDRQYSLFDYITENTTVFYLDYDRLLNAEKMLLNEYVTSYRTARQELPVLPPKIMLFDFERIVDSHFCSIFFRSLDTMLKIEADEKQENLQLNLEENEENAEAAKADHAAEVEKKDLGQYFTLNAQTSQSYFGDIRYFKEQLDSLQKERWHIYIYADNANQSVRIKELVKEFMEVEDNALFPLEIFPQSISEGFSVADEKILVIQESQIFGRRKAPPKSIRKAKSQAINTFVELTPGDYVVHVNYGIGLFKGIERVKSMGTERDFIKLEYAGEEYAFVPIEQVNMVQRYIGSETEKPRMDKIGGKSWNTRKAKVQQQVEEMAEKLIDLYSKRQASRGFAFPKDTEWQAAFEAAFPYEDTPDQYNATQDIKEDMEKPVPMDRLVCGDVGYGKTEIAMRAAFKAVMGGKQVAFLAPTTILAEQHYENCKERFKNFPVEIAQMSRFVSPQEQKKILEKVKQGKIDILIGTHRIIQKDVEFKDLGLMIIDEEQRFGVKDKEKLKVLKNNIDSLAMSATPIPRTLHMSLLKIRDMSLLTTPPQNRQPVETAVEPYNDEKLAQAIRREVDRGGQIFYLHNRVESLEDTALKIQHLVPEMMVETAHGQMSSDELDDIFRRFKMGGFHILVATTIIENGIDIPNVNTIIIDRADIYGVSQLYQLRGRVGRSDRKAYAYLFYPENKALSEVAMKRLQVISDFTELGSGFKIAMKDMEIRGAGNLLGKDQSGEVYAVGFEMYLHLLNSAIERLTVSGWHPQEETILELEYSGFIPSTYIDESEIKMEIYKKIASVSDQFELDALNEELEDRFGPIPEELHSLLSMASIRIVCKKLRVNSLKEKKGEVKVNFGDTKHLNVDKIIKLVSTSGGRVSLNPANPSEIIMKTGNIDLKAKSDFIREKLELCF